MGKVHALNLRKLEVLIPGVDNGLWMDVVIVMSPIRLWTAVLRLGAILEQGRRHVVYFHN